MSKKRACEQRFCCEMRSGAHAAGEAWHKIPDCAGPGTQKRPFDAFFTAGPVTVALEAKYFYTDRNATFNLREFKPHQIENLVDMDRRPNWRGAGAIRWNREGKPIAVVIVIEDLVELMGRQDRVTEAELMSAPFVRLERSDREGVVWNIVDPSILNMWVWEPLP